MHNVNKAQWKTAVTVSLEYKCNFYNHSGKLSTDCVYYYLD